MRSPSSIAGSMRVIACTAVESGDLKAPCRIDYEISADGVRPFVGQQVFETWTRQWPQPGDVLPVMFGRDRSGRVQIRIEPLPAPSRSTIAQVSPLAAALRSGAAAPAAGASWSAGPAGGWARPGLPITSVIVRASAGPA
jgi:hypothetical protein